MPVVETLIRDYRSGEEVEPGIYLDMETGDVVHVLERDTLPEGMRVVHYARRFRKVAPADPSACRAA
jgi:hypothetical protein